MRAVSDDDNVSTEAARLAEKVLDAFGPLYLDAIDAAASEPVREAFRTLHETANRCPDCRSQVYDIYDCAQCGWRAPK